MKARAEARYELAHDLDPMLLATSEDVDAMIEALLTGPAYHNMAQVHSTERGKLPSGAFDHELLVGVNADLQVGAVTFMDASGNYATVGNPGSREDPVFHIMGHMTEFPEESEISIELVRQAVKEFISSGGRRPGCVAWKEMEW